MKADDYRDWDQRADAITRVYTANVDLEDAGKQVHRCGDADGQTDRDVVHFCTTTNPGTTTRENGVGKCCCTDDDPARERGGLILEVVVGARWLAIAWALSV